MNSFRITIAALLLTGQVAIAQTVTTITTGDAKLSTTWDCACVPGPSSDLIVDHDIFLNDGATYNSVHITPTGRLKVSVASGLSISNDLVVDAGGILKTNRYTAVSGDFVLNGTWSGNQSLDLRGAGTDISGTGTITNTATLYLKGGNKNILPGTVLEKLNGIINVNNISVFSQGSISTSVMSSSGLAKWYNQDNSRIEFISVLTGPMRLYAFGTDNTVAFTKVGAFQNIKTPISSTFYNLELSSSGSSFRKIMLSDLLINGDLILTDCLLETESGGDVRNIEIKGNWTATGGNLLPKTGTVTFTNTDPITITNDNSERFNLLNLNGSDVTIEGSVMVASDLISSANISMGSGAYDLSVAGDFVNTGAFVANDSRIIMDGGAAQVLSGNFPMHDLTIDNSGAGVTMDGGDHSITGTLELVNGQLDTDDRLTMISNADGDSRIAEITAGSIVGELTAQRYIDGGATNWRFLTSPTQANTIGDWTDDFSTSGFTGSTWPTFSFTSIYFHDESAPGTLHDGFVAATDVSDAIEPGAGIWVWCGDNMSGTSPFTIDVKGEAYTGDVSLPVSYTDHGSPADDGWNMVANPYVSAIDWDSPNWTKTDIDDAIYIWVPELEQFASYVGGVSVNGGSRYVASSQAFWVHATSASSQLTASEGVKTDQSVGFKNITIQEDPDLLRMSMSKGSMKDEMVLRISEEATAAFDGGLDALERNSANENAPNMSSLSSNGEPLMINSFPLASMDSTIQLAFDVVQNGNYTIEFSELTGAFSRACLILEDTQTGTQTAVVEGSSTSVALSAGFDDTRFKLILAGGVDYVSNAPSCPGSADGSVVAVAKGNGPHDYTWFDMNNNVVRTVTGVVGGDTLSGLPAGAYTVSISMPTPCSSISVVTEIFDPAEMHLEGTIANSSCNGQPDGMIDLLITGGEAPYTVLWSNGSTNMNLDQLLPGQYDATVTDAKGCTMLKSFDVQTDMPVVAAFSAPQMGQVGVPVIFQTNSVGAISALWEMGDGESYNTTVSPVHVYSQPGVYTITLTVMNGSCTDVFTQDIEIENTITTGIQNDLQQAADEVTFGQNNGQLYLIVNGIQTMELTVMVSNLVGQQLVAPITGTFTPGKNLIDLSGNQNRVIVISAFDEQAGKRWAKRVFF